MHNGGVSFAMTYRNIYFLWFYISRALTNAATTFTTACSPSLPMIRSSCYLFYSFFFDFGTSIVSHLKGGSWPSGFFCILLMFLCFSFGPSFLSDPFLNWEWRIYFCSLLFLSPFKWQVHLRLCRVRISYRAESFQCMDDNFIIIIITVSN